LAWQRASQSTRTERRTEHIFHRRRKRRTRNRIINSIKRMNEWINSKIVIHTLSAWNGGNETNIQRLYTGSHATHFLSHRIQDLNFSLLLFMVFAQKKTFPIPSIFWQNFWKYRKEKKLSLCLDSRYSFSVGSHYVYNYPIHGSKKAKKIWFIMLKKI
jgi:hypothetical protein